jgi:hypothetical protein
LKEEEAMEFRWIAAITLWTMLSGPVLIHWSTAIPRPGSEPPPSFQRWTAYRLQDVDALETTPVLFDDDAAH